MTFSARPQIDRLKSVGLWERIEPRLPVHQIQAAEFQCTALPVFCPGVRGGLCSSAVLVTLGGGGGDKMWSPGAGAFAVIPAKAMLVSGSRIFVWGRGVFGSVADSG